MSISIKSMTYSKMTQKVDTKGRKIGRKQVFAVLSAVMPKQRAKVLAGYPDSSPRTPEVPEFTGTIAEIRERLQEAAGSSLVSQVKWYASIRDNGDEGTTDRITAAKQIDTVLGYNAPQRVEINSNHHITGAILAIQQIACKTGLTPQALKDTLDAHKQIGHTQALLDNTGSIGASFPATPSMENGAKIGGVPAPIFFGHPGVDLGPAGGDRVDGSLRVCPAPELTLQGGI